MLHLSRRISRPCYEAPAPFLYTFIRYGAKRTNEEMKKEEDEQALSSLARPQIERMKDRSIRPAGRQAAREGGPAKKGDEVACRDRAVMTTLLEMRGEGRRASEGERDKKKKFPAESLEQSLSRREHLRGCVCVKATMPRIGEERTMFPIIKPFWLGWIEWSGDAARLDGRFRLGGNEDESGAAVVER